MTPSKTPHATTICLVRHAQSAPSDDVAEADWPLSTLGEQQAQALIETLAPLDITEVVSSPYRRAVATLQPFASHIGASIVIEHDLRERLLTLDPHADWQRMLEYHWRNPHHAEPGAESNVACEQRVRSCLTRIAQRLTGKNVVVASHGNAIALMLGAIDPSFGYEGWRSMKNPDCFRLRYESQRWHWLR
ncbi:MAG: histidine phosphatase family protein [Gammaproteobacteria bacterium]|nr:histidine phosphatase family protein [Gammaproteobacteria bacterium]